MLGISQSELAFLRGLVAQHVIQQTSYVKRSQPGSRAYQLAVMELKTARSVMEKLEKEGLER